jgi:site-specific DNA-methyltransferase (adenine-specific)
VDKFHTTESAAQYLGITPSRVRQLILTNRLESQKVGRDHLIKEAVLRKFNATGRMKRGRPQK